MEEKLEELIDQTKYRVLYSGGESEFWVRADAFAFALTVSDPVVVPVSFRYESTTYTDDYGIERLHEALREEVGSPITE